MAEGNGAVGFTESKSSSHSISASLNLNIFDHANKSGTAQTSSPSWSYSKTFGDKSSSHSYRLTPTSGRLTQMTSDYLHNHSDMLWRISVVVRKENMVLNGTPRSAHSLVDVTRGISFLRQADPVTDPRREGGTLHFPDPPPNTVPMLRTNQAHDPDGPGPLTPHHSEDSGAYVVPTMPATPRGDVHVPKVPLLPGPAVSERIMAPGPNHHPGDPLPVLEVSGEGNPVLDAVQRLLQENAPGMLDGHWTVQEARGGQQLPAAGPEPAPVRRVSAKLSNLLNMGSMEALVDLMLGPGLILTGTRSLPLVNERVQILLRATRDPNNRGYAFLEHVDSANVSKYVFRLNALAESSSKPSTHSATASGGPVVRDAPVNEGRFGNASAGGSVQTSTTVSNGHSVMKTDAARDTFFTPGPADRYAGELNINVSVTKTIMPSRLTNSILLTLPSKIAGLVQDTGNRDVQRPSIDVPMVERVLIPSELLKDGNNIVPPTAPDDVAVREVPSGSTAESLDLPPFAITKDDLLHHDVVNFGFDHAKVRVLFDEALRRFSGGGSFAVARLVEAGTRAQDAMHYLISQPMLTRQLEFMLTEAGLKSPGLVREGGPITDTSGHLTMKVELANPHVRGYATSWNEAVDYRFKEFNRNASKSSSQTLNINAGSQENSGSLAPDLPPNSHAHQTPGDSINVSMGRNVQNRGFAVLKTMPVFLASHQQVPWLRVSADAIFHFTIDARNTRDLIDLPGGTVTIAFKVDNALELGIAPETALQHGLIHPHGLTIPSGVFAAAHGALDTHGVPNDTVEILRAAYLRPPNDNHFFVHANLNADGHFIVGNQALTPAEFHQQVLARHNLDGRTLVMVTEGGDTAPPGGMSAAEHLAGITGRPVLATTGRLQTTRDGAIHAHTGPDGTRGAILPSGNPANWTLLTPHRLSPLHEPTVQRTNHGGVLDHALSTIAARPAAGPQPTHGGPDTSHGGSQQPPEGGGSSSQRTGPFQPSSSSQPSRSQQSDTTTHRQPRGTQSQSQPQSDSAGKGKGTAPEPSRGDPGDAHAPADHLPPDAFDVTVAHENFTSAQIAVRNAERAIDTLDARTPGQQGSSDGIHIAAHRALGRALERLATARTAYEDLQARYDAAHTPTSAPSPTPPSRLASRSTPHLPTGGEWHTMSPLPRNGRESGVHAESTTYTVSDTGWIILSDNTWLRPDGWQRSGNEFVQTATSAVNGRSTTYTMDGSGNIHPGEARSEDSSAVNVTVTADMFGLHVRPTSGVDVTYIPLMNHASHDSDVPAPAP